jgi:ABC-type sugar transport system permease subunit/ABC-type glycerol-3-phosphate transport system substrate-binding protein
MEPKKALFLGLLLIVAAWLLYPPRQLEAPKESNIVEIVYMGPGGPLAGALADVIREFELQSERAHAEDPSKPIYRVISGQNAARDQVADPTRFLVSVAGGSPPDVIQFDRYAVAEWAARGGFTPLDSFIEADKQQQIDTPNREKFYEAAWNEAMYEGKVYGIPIGIDNRALMYNKDALRRAGMVDASGVPIPPKTWDELVVANRKLTLVEERSTGKQLTLDQYFQQLPAGAKRKLDTKTHQLVNVGFIPMFGNSWLYIFGWMNGGEFMSADGKTVTLNDPKIAEALNWVFEIYEEMGGFKEVQSFQAGFQGGALDPFISGKVAMKIDGFWQMSTLGQFGRTMDFAIAPPPMPKAQIDKGNDKISWTGGWAYSIPTTAKNKQAGWELIRFLTSRKAIELMRDAEKQLADAEGRIFFPNQLPQQELNEWQYEKYTFSNEAVDKKYVDAVRNFNSLLPYSRFRPITPIGQQLWNYHISAAEAALYGDKPAQAALDEATGILQQQLDLFFKPTSGTPITSWTWFYILYAVIIVAGATLIYLWDANFAFRSSVGKLLGMSAKARESVVDGARGGYTRQQWFGGYVCASPWILGFLIFGGGPMLFSLVISFCRWDILNTPVFVGFDNYHRMFTQDELIPIGLWNTFFMVLAVPAGMILSLLIALLLNQGARALPFFRTMFYLPSIVPFVATSLLFVWIFNTQGGLLTRFVEFFGLTSPRWLQDPSWAKTSLIIMGLWGAGGGMILWLAGLKAIPQSLYEAASVDGATRWQQFWSVTIPQLTPYIFFNLVMGLIGTLQVFGQAFVMTQGGPQNSTMFYVYHLFNNAFRYGQMGYASAMAWLLLAIALVLTVIQMRMSKRWVHYDTA